MKQEKTNDVFCLKLDKDFREHLDKQAVKKNLRLGTYIKAVLKKHSKYKKPELV